MTMTTIDVSESRESIITSHHIRIMERRRSTTNDDTIRIYLYLYKKKGRRFEIRSWDTFKCIKLDVKPKPSDTILAFSRSVPVFFVCVCQVYRIRVLCIKKKLQFTVNFNSLPWGLY